MKNKNENFFYLNLSSLVTGEVGDTKKEIIKEENLFTPNEIFNNIIADINFIRATNTIIAIGKICAKIKIICSRCNTEMTQTIKSNFEEEYFLYNNDILGSHRGKKNFQPEDFIDREKNHLDKRNFLDLSFIFINSLYSEISIAPRCSEDCKGICINCLKNLNYEKCLCK